MAGRIVAGLPVRQACQRHLDDLKRADLKWEPDRVDHVLEFFRDFLVLPDGEYAGEPFKIESWAMFTVGSLHGWRLKDGHRRFQFAYVETGKGQAKTPVGCGLAVYAMVADGMSGAQAYVAARARNQAGASFRDCERILGPLLKRRLEVLANNINDPKTGGFICPVSSEARTLEGGRVYFALLDEVGLHKNDDVLLAMQRGTKQHRDAIIFAITNAGEDRESVAWGLHNKGRQILEGTLKDDAFFAYICALDPCETCRADGHLEPRDGCEDCDDWHDESVWLKTSPLLGITLPIEYIRKEVKMAEDIPSSESSVRRFNFCSWLRSEARWFTPDQWGACGTSPDDLKGRPAILGIDLSNTKDLTAAVLIVPSPDYFAVVSTDEQGRVVVSDMGGHVDVRCWVWAPEAMINEQTRRGVPYETWVRQGAMLPIDGDVIHRGHIVQHIASLRDDGYWIQEIAYDPAFANEFALDLKDQHGFAVVPIAQVYQTLTQPCMLLETLVMTKRLRHGNSPVMRWAAANVILEIDSGGRMRPSKKKSAPHGKIDPISALVTGLAEVHVLKGLAQAGHEAIIGPQRVTVGGPW